MDHRLRRRIGSVGIALILGTAALSFTGPAKAESTVLELFSQPIEADGQMIGVLTDAPAGTDLQVYVNGRLRDTTQLRTHSTGEDYISYRRSWGLGTLQLRDGTTASKPVPMLAAVKLRPYSLKRFGPGATRLRVKVTAKRYHPGKNRWVKTRRPLLQVKQGKWRTIRKVKLNQKGKGKVTLRPKKAFRYRIVVARTKSNHRTVETTMGKI